MTEERLIPSVVVVGGGYAGLAVAKALDERTKVTLVEPRDAFVHNVAALRAAVDPTIAPKIFLPYDRLLAHGEVVRDRAVRVDGAEVELASGGCCGRTSSFLRLGRATRTRPRQTGTTAARPLRAISTPTSSSAPPDV